ncbi:hypothetical protein F5148DRAFT_1267070 [Russula earlei]|uniref:Uncharacterized protein n=1 Tax=Russula earlei TaxID=71964 RepID=A0ACC0TS15_9AGAM|nr:hypothetical protein F5148DRAFT_1267070 [Russula earlei]
MPPPLAGANRTIEDEHHHHRSSSSSIQEGLIPTAGLPTPSSEPSLAPPSSPEHQYQHPDSAVDRFPAQSCTLPEIDPSQVMVQSRVRSCASSLPASSLPSSSAATLAAPPPSPSHGQNEDTREPSLELLRETPELYNLTAPGARKLGQHRRARAGVSEAARRTGGNVVIFLLLIALYQFRANVNRSVRFRNREAQLIASGSCSETNAA